MLDIFNSDAFSVTSLTDALRDLKPRPTRLGDLGLFETSSIATTTITIEKVGDILQIVAPTPRGGPGETRDMPKRNMRAINVPHFQRDWAVYADEVQGVRRFGTENALETVQSKVMERIDNEVMDFDVTDEYSRLGAIQGIVTYKGGDTLDLFSVFGVGQPAEINFDIANTIDGNLRERCTNVIRQVRAALGGLPFGNVHAFVGDNFFDALLKNAEVRATYMGWSEAAILRDSYVGKNRGENPIFEFGGITFENYGAIEQTGDGALMGIGTDKAKFVPIGVPGLFRTYHAPADYNETVNTLGERLYARQWEMKNGKGIEGEVQTNPLHICTRPHALLRAKRAA